MKKIKDFNKLNFNVSSFKLGSSFSYLNDASEAYMQIIRMAGSDLNDLFLLLFRSDFNDFPDDENTSSFILHIQNDQVSIILQTLGCVKDLWLSPAQNLYIIATLDERKGLHLGRLIEGNYLWTYLHEMDLERSIQVRGVWGLNDQYFFTWGEELQVSDSKISTLPFSYLFNGKSWESLPTPFNIISMHGVDRHHIVIVGDSCAYLQENSWKIMEMDSKQSFQSVRCIKDKVFVSTFVKSEIFDLWDRGYIYSNHQNAYPYAWMKWGTKMKMTQWPEGLYTGQAENFKALVPPMGLAPLLTGKYILWSRGDSIMQSEDFKSFDSISLSSLEQVFNASFWPY